MITSDWMHRRSHVSLLRSPLPRPTPRNRSSTRQWNAICCLHRRRKRLGTEMSKRSSVPYRIPSMRAQYDPSFCVLRPTTIRSLSSIELGPLSNPCLSQPCLNGGQCVATDVTTFQCQCAAGFDGTHCELDAQICQTQQPCGQAIGTKCQSFRPNAALQFVCIHQNGLAYGLSAQQSNASPKASVRRWTCVFRLL